MDPQIPFIILQLVAGLFLLLVLGTVIIKYGSLWVQATLLGVPVPLFEMIAMSLRKVDARKVVEARISAKKAGIEIGVDPLQRHALAGGNIPAVVDALIVAKERGLQLNFDDACAIDLSGRNVQEIVRMQAAQPRA